MAGYKVGDMEVGDQVEIQIYDTYLGWHEIKSFYNLFPGARGVEVDYPKHEGKIHESHIINHKGKSNGI